MYRNSSSDTAKIPKLHHSIGFALWRIYVMELLRKKGVLPSLKEDPPDLEKSSPEAVSRLERDDERDLPQIVVNVGEEPKTLITSLLLTDATKMSVCKKID